MSDLDENLTSILSSLIDTEVIEAPSATELTDASTFNSSRLDFENLASCITGSDASLHQCSDDNVSSLLESHLNELAQTENASIVEAAAQQLDDVTPFDLDKPIESLLETGPSAFTSQECSESQIPIVDESAELQSASNELSTIQDATSNELENEISNDLSQIEVVPTFLPNQSNHIEADEVPILNAPEEIEEVNGPTQEIFESTAGIENESDQPGVDENNLDEAVANEVERIETIIADQIVDETLSKESNSKSEVKKRRRILVYNDEDSDNSELEEERGRLLQSKSPSPSPVRQSGDIENQNILPNDADHIAGEEDYIRDPNEKPGPKSKKQSTYLYNALKAKALIESAIVIPARKKKKRVIDSDDEYGDSVLNQPIASVDDIGLIPDDSNPIMPFDVSIEIEQKEIEADTEPKIRVKSDLIGEPASGLIKIESLSRSTTQAKMEKYHAINNKRNHREKEPEDIFGTPLNAPYVDSSSDEDYFLPQDKTKKNQQSHTQRWSINSSSMHQRRRKGHIPDDVYFNAKVPLHVLYSYDDSSDDDEKKDRLASNSTHSQKLLVQPTNRALNKMPPVHKIVPQHTHGRTKVQRIVPKQPERVIKAPKPAAKPAAKPTVFEQLDKLKRLLRASGIKININELLKGSKTFQERCERIRDILYRNGIEGEPTLAKCKKLKKQLKLKEEIAGLDPSAIIELKEEEGLPKRTTRRATRRNYVYDDPEDAKKPVQPEIREDAAQLLQKMKEFVDSDSEYEADADDHSQNSNGNSNSIDPTNMVETVIESVEQNVLSETIPAQTQIESPHALEEHQLIQTSIDDTSTQVECTTSSDQV